MHKKHKINQIENKNIKQDNRHEKNILKNNISRVDFFKLPT